MKRLLLILIAIVSIILIFLLTKRRNAAPEIPFTRVVKETVVSALTTNGKVEPIEWASARAEAAGLVRRVAVKRGDRVAAGAVLVELDAGPAQGELAAAEAKVAQSQAELQTIQAGGRAAEVATIQGSIDAAKLELAAAQRDYEANLRLQQKKAVTGVEVTASKERVDRAKQQIAALEARRGVLVTAPDRSAAEARLREARAAVDSARQKLAMLTVKAPVGGTVYQFDLKPGAYLNPGDLVANIGRLDNVRVIVYVDEPDLGRVEIGMPVTITWDAIPGRQWTGAVERKPSQVIALGTRQVGEVGCVIGNPDLDLLAGTNVNAEIRSKVVDGALTVPNAALRREAGKIGVFVLSGKQIEWREVKLGVASVVKSQVLAGLNEGDSVALPTDKTLKEKMPVAPVYP
ncbi:MAG: efflux RND transporter periplasmic adaptor subunit [Acidobacteria bacterium]|nr:efflux RND transporter periplasmic adaptor subunit [Acidobacteriota bacterium]